MGETAQGRDITIEFECQFRVDLQHSDFSSIMKAFLMLLPQLLEDFFQKVLVGFGEYEMANGKNSRPPRKCATVGQLESAMSCYLGQQQPGGNPGPFSGRA